MFTKSLISLMVTITFILMTSAAGISTVSADTPGYWTTKSGKVWRNSFGQCWRTKNWTPENAITACEDMVVSSSVTDIAAGTAPAADIDSDGDGIADSRDKCPSSRKGDKVDARGCKMDEVIVLKGVNFETNSDALVADSFASLNEIVTTLKRYPAMKVEVAGYTDNRGSVSYNESLSQKRAEAVVAYLVSKGVSADNLKAKGYGPKSPIADNSTAAGQAKNRRVELHILTR